jgi:hypothetical protein
MARASHLFSTQPAYQIRTANLRPHAGDMVFRGENPPNGALLDYWLASAGGAVKLSVRDQSGALVQELKTTNARGINRVVWNLRHADIPIRSGGGDDDEEGPPRTTTPGPLVLPGVYTVQLDAGGVTSTQRVTVREDPRLEISAADRRTWTAFQRQIAALATQFAPVVERARAAGGTETSVVEHRRQVLELMARIGTLYNATARWTGRPTADQQSRLAYYQQMARRLESGGRSP